MSLDRCVELGAGHLFRLADLLLLPSQLALVSSNEARGVSKIAYFCPKLLIFCVCKCKYVYTEEYTKMFCPMCALKAEKAKIECGTMHSSQTPYW